MGCGRTLEEIANWSRLDEAQRQAVAAGLPERLAALDMTIDNQAMAIGDPSRSMQAG